MPDNMARMPPKTRENHPHREILRCNRYNLLQVEPEPQKVSQLNGD